MLVVLTVLVSACFVSAEKMVIGKHSRVEAC